MMDLESAIQHCEEVARQNEEDAILYSNCKKYKKNLYEIGLAENAEKKCCECANEHRQLAEWLKELKAYKEKESLDPSKELAKAFTIGMALGFGKNYDEMYKIMEAIKAVTPQQKIGHWILTDVEGNRVWHCRCSECDKDPQDYIDGSEDWWLIKNNLPKACPTCGVKMEVIE